MVGVVVTCLSWLGRQFSFCWNNFGTLAILSTLLALLLDYMKWRNRDSRLPPGPTPLPFIGNLLLLDRKNPYKTLTYLEKNFGEVVLVQAGWKKIVVLNGYKAIKQTVIEKSRDFVDRLEFPLLKLIGRRKNCGGIFTACYNSWKEQRKFCISVLKHFQNTFTNSVTEEAGYLCSEFKSKEGLPFDPENLVSKAVTNTLWNLIFGKRFEYSDEYLAKLIDHTEKMMKSAAGAISLLLVVAGEWMRYIPGPHHKFQKDYADCSAMIKEAMNKRKKNRDPNSPRDLIDMFLNEIEKTKGNPNSSFNEQNLVNIVLDMLVAGSMSSSFSIRWGLLILALHPETQERMCEEIDKVIGRTQSPTMDDHLNLPYACAAIHEIQRYADISPAVLPRVTRKDVEVGKYIIPKDTIVIPHLSSLMKEETMWEKPHEFYPEHFLDTNGQLVKKANFLPFSAGHHVCPGEQLAKMELFIFFTSLLQHFKFVIPENSPGPEEKKVFRLNTPAPPFQISAVPR